MLLPPDQLQSPPALDADLLIRFLSDRDAPCPACGYNLRNLQGNRCPECGDELVLKVNVADARLAPLISGLVGLSAGAGLNGLLVLYALIRLIIEGHYSSFMTPFFLTTGIGVVVMGCALRLWLKFWPKIRRAGKPVQWRLVATAWFLTFLDLAIFAVAIK